MTPEQIARLAYRAGFRGDKLETAVAVAMAESSGNPKVKGDLSIQDGTWGPSVGLWQIRSVNAEKGKGTSRDELANLNPLHNARAAWTESHHGTSFQPWTMYTNGGYNKHLGAARKAASAVERDARDGKLQGDRSVGGGPVGKGRNEAAARGKPRSRQGSGGPGRSGRITISIPELSKLATGLAGHERAVSVSRANLLGVSTALQQLQAQAGVAAPVQRVLATLDELIGERRMGTVTLPRMGRQLSTDVEIVTRCRNLARQADDGSLGTMPAAQVAKVLRDARAHGATLSVLAVLEAALFGRLAGKATRKPTAGRPGSNRPGVPKSGAKPGASAGRTGREKKVARILALAKKQVGTREKGENRTKYGQWYKLDGQPWCAMFVSWCFAKAGVPLADLQKGDPSKTGFAGVASGAQALKAKGMLHNKPKAGDIVLYSDQGGHTGIVTSVSSDGKSYTTIEGNAGDRVLEAKHTLGDRAVYGFGRPL